MLPSGTVTFLFTDIEGSSRLWEEHPQAMSEALAHHDALLRDVIQEHQGFIVKTTGDGVHAVFESPATAIREAHNSPMTAREQTEYDNERTAFQAAAGKLPSKPPGAMAGK